VKEPSATGVNLPESRRGATIFGSVARDDLGVSTAAAGNSCTAYSFAVASLVSKDTHPARADFHEHSRQR
jgi:hypothetical protein